MASSIPDASFLEDLRDNFLQCPVHLDRFEKPKMLPCLHSVCLSCLSQWHQQMGGEDQVTCPQCRKVCTVPSDGVQDFPDNFFMNNLLEYVNQAGGESYDDNKRCDVCEKDSPNVEVMRCGDCSMFLCSVCTTSHKKIPSTASHQLIPVAEFNELSVADKLSLVSPLCPKHPASRLEFFCTKCNIAVCTQCTVVVHRAPVHSIQELAEAFTKIQKQLKGEIKGSGKRHSKVQLAIADTTATMTELEAQRDVAYETAQQQADSIIELVSQFLTDLEEQIDQQYTDKKEVLDERLEDLLAIEEDFKHTQEFGERVMQYGNQVTLASVGPEIISKLKGLSSTFQKKEGVEVKADLHFQINQEFESELCSDSIGLVTDEEDQYEERESEEEEDFEEKDFDEDVPMSPSTVEQQPIQYLMAIPSAELTFIERTYKGKTVPEKTLQLPIRVRDSYGNPVQEADDTVWDCKMQKPNIPQESYEELKRSGLSVGDASICQHDDGTKFISFLARVPGRFVLYVTMNGKPIKSYPYTVQVYHARPVASVAPEVAKLDQLVSNMANLQMQLLGGGCVTDGFVKESKAGHRRRRKQDNSSDTESITSDTGSQGGGRGRGRGGRGGGRGGRGSAKGSRNKSSGGVERQYSGEHGGKEGSRGRGGRGGSGYQKISSDGQSGRATGGESNERGNRGGRGGRHGSSERGGRGGERDGKGGDRGGRGGKGGDRGGRGGQRGTNPEKGSKGGDKSARGGKGSEKDSKGNERGKGGNRAGGNRGRGGKGGN